ncbi:MAG: nucleoside deaminase [Mariprofundaceae bacterium]|nr:nucleoside deaminase [Mariprofundaceae bacterium]
MDFVITLSKLHVQHGTGGPFAAAIFARKDHTLVAVGLNIVVASACSILHAEMVAITLAQATLQTFNLKEQGDFELLSSCEPCAMCFGALPWSGIQHLACAANTADAQAIGFDEGPKHPQWKQTLEQRGIQVSTGIQQQQAAAVLQQYQAMQGVIYNA